MPNFKRKKPLNERKAHIVKVDVGMNQKRFKNFGNDSKLNEEIIEEFCDVIRKGGTVKRAAALCGIAYNTIFEYLRRGRGEDDKSQLPIYKAFAAAVASAEAEYLSECEACVLEAIRQGDAQLALKVLSIRDAQDWAGVSKTELTGKVEHSIEVKLVPQIYIPQPLPEFVGGIEAVKLMDAQNKQLVEHKVDDAEFTEEEMVEDAG